MSTTASDTYADFAEWREPRPAATVGDAMREFTGTPVEVLLVWFARFDRGPAEAREVASRLAASSRLAGMAAYLARHADQPQAGVS